MITKLFNNPHVLFQPTDENGFNEVAIGASVDGGGMIVLEQEGRHIVISPGAVPELCRLLRQLQKEGSNG
ncbi:TPA: hypothetical protein UL939_000550 [Stenotrophomonas maltophilia]|jgi:hypothetical protein|uniref:Uncharacterized protein n=1 Tax=Stenotrophomonas maltophilia TaxID=40324 RepID=A0AA40YAG1_STEMA|nr:hypothetical protein [Stenotrophomonas sp. GD04032]AWB79599.1 hypothetical protein B7H26_17440 [Stenotrophomonas maltophilia]MDU4431562.1 hypothetical protein [Pluralibacter gergoviae]MBH1792031.1 hypothetical protein [Stenotrophomonas maltophilia]MDG9972968.1 hypothetical protein [Stenotrophomonas sp. GD04032]HEL2965705.1 hypothetical protein [Stenotrophomonas maltophilia]